MFAAKLPNLPTKVPPIESTQLSNCYDCWGKKNGPKTLDVRDHTSRIFVNTKLSPSESCDQSCQWAVISDPRSPGAVTVMCWWSPYAHNDHLVNDMNKHFSVSYKTIHGQTCFMGGWMCLTKTINGVTEAETEGAAGGLAAECVKGWGDKGVFNWMCQHVMTISIIHVFH